MIFNCFLLRLKNIRYRLILSLNDTFNKALPYNSLSLHDDISRKLLELDIVKWCVDTKTFKWSDKMFNSSKIELRDFTVSAPSDMEVIRLYVIGKNTDPNNTVSLSKKVKVSCYYAVSTVRTFRRKLKKKYHHKTNLNFVGVYTEATKEVDNDNLKNYYLLDNENTVIKQMVTDECIGVSLIEPVIQDKIVKKQKKEILAMAESLLDFGSLGTFEVKPPSNDLISSKISKAIDDIANIKEKGILAISQRNTIALESNLYEMYLLHRDIFDTIINSKNNQQLKEFILQCF